MSKTVSISYISGNIIQQIKYNDFNDLSDQLKLLIIYHDSDIIKRHEEFNIRVYNLFEQYTRDVLDRYR